ncbi:hypothetical protein PRZ48_005074 [Zasmidium cellare]|uniref:F-box domain-containing protein n=1 Tax=Zasmidium cellare TaxID=395010 RepID=A0ABR0ETI6_ZASCE|nr:hypothetical protein PRZ48_005074 [Zasmidium cellare]
MSEPLQPPETSPDMAEKKTLLSFPPELLEAVAEEADPSDLLTLRLVSKSISSAVDRLFLDEYFTHRNHLLTADSLEDLVAITATPHMCKKIEKLTITIPWLDNVFLKWSYSGTYTISWDARHTKRRAISRSWEEQHELLIKDERGCALLEEAFDNIARTGHGPLSLMLTPGDERGRRVHGKARLDAGLDVRTSTAPKKYFDRPLVDICQAVSLLLDAIDHTGISLHDLQLPAGFPFQSVRECSSRYGTPDYHIAASFSSMKRLCLTQGIKRNADEHWTHGGSWVPANWIPRFKEHAASWFPSLTTLCISVHLPLPWLTETFSSAMLRRIEVYDGDKSGMWRYGYEEWDLTRFVGKYQSTLAEFRVANWDGREGGPVTSALAWAAANLKLQQLEVQGWSHTFEGHLIDFIWYDNFEDEFCQLLEGLTERDDISDEDDGFYHHRSCSTSNVRIPDELDYAIARDPAYPGYKRSSGLKWPNGS